MGDGYEDGYEEAYAGAEAISADAAPSNYEPFASPIVAFANTGDGSRLVLRSAPSTEYGRRVGRIDAGARVEVFGCLDGLDRADGRTSRWCRVREGRTSGWAFAAFLAAY